jgi:acyl carrier protein
MATTKDEILRKISDYLAEFFEVPRAKITPDARLYEDMDLDSIDAVDLIVKLQELTQKKIAPADFKEVRTINDVVEKVYELLEK